MFEPYVIKKFIEILESDERSVDRDLHFLDCVVCGGYASKGETEELEALKSLSQLFVIVRGFVRHLEKED